MTRCALALSACLLLTTPSIVAADVFRLDFTVAGFTTPTPPPDAPEDPLSGWVLFEAPDISSLPSAILDINLTINGHAYTPSEVLVVEASPTRFILGGVENGLDIYSQTDDFALIYEIPLQPLSFLYASALVEKNVWNATTFDEFRVSRKAVPEPTVLALLAVGTAGIAFRRRSR